jgi:hypothetical protein
VIDPHGHLPEKSGRAANEEEKEELLETANVLCCAVLCCAVLCCAVLCCAVLIIADFLEKASAQATSFTVSPLIVR